MELQQEIEEAKKQELERSQHKQEEDIDLDNYMNSLNESLNKKKLRPLHILNKELENLKKVFLILFYYIMIIYIHIFIII